MQPNGLPANSRVPHSISFDEEDLIHYALSSGYFSHVTTLAEVKEQVLKYIPVMARPMVLLKEYHPIKWTGVHVDNKVSSKHTIRCLLLFC